MRISDWSSDVCSSDLPNLVAHAGEAYRDRLKALAHDLGVGNNIAFIAEFVEQGDLIDYLQAADPYVTPLSNTAPLTPDPLSHPVEHGSATRWTQEWRSGLLSEVAAAYEKKFHT